MRYGCALSHAAAAVIESRLRMLEHLRARDVEKTVQEYTDYMQKALRSYLRDVQLEARNLAQASQP